MSIIEKIETKVLGEICNRLKLKSILLFGSILRPDFNENSDIDIAILGEEEIKLSDILNLELLFEELLGRTIDVVDLRSKTLDIFIKIEILNTAKTLYSEDNDQCLEHLKEATEQYYRINEDYFFFRRRDLLT